MNIFLFYIPNLILGGEEKMQNFRFNGLLKEDVMVLAINNKTFKELNNNLKKFLNCLFGAIKPNEVILCEKN